MLLLDVKGICCRGANNLIFFVYFPHSFQFPILLNFKCNYWSNVNDKVWKVTKTFKDFLFSVSRTCVACLSVLESKYLSISSHVHSFIFILLLLYLFTQFDYMNGSNQINTTKILNTPLSISWKVRLKLHNSKFSKNWHKFWNLLRFQAHFWRVGVWS